MRELPIGIAPRAELVYRTLLRRCRWRSPDLAAGLGWPVREVRELVEKLRVDGLVTVSADDPDAVRAVEPSLALPAMTARRLCAPAGGSGAGGVPRAAAVERFIAFHERAAERHQESGAGAGSVGGVHGGGLDEVAAVVERLVAGVRHEAVFLVPVYAPGSFEFSTFVAEAVLRRGGTMRSLWHSDFLALPPVVAHARWLGARRAVPRTAQCIPTRAIILDRAVAVVVDDDRRARTVRGNAALDSLCRLADHLWEKAVEVRTAAEVCAAAIPGHPGPTQPRSELVLRLLAAGLTDDAVARRIGVSVRTVRNDVASVMAHLDARSRFQAGMRAAQLGLL